MSAEPSCPQCGSTALHEITGDDYRHRTVRSLGCDSCGHQWGHEGPFYILIQPEKP